MWLPEEDLAGAEAQEKPKGGKLSGQTGQREMWVILYFKTQFEFWYLSMEMAVELFPWSEFCLE